MTQAQLCIRRSIPKMVFSFRLLFFLSQKDALHFFLGKVVTDSNYIGKIMASFLVRLGRFAFFVLMGIQSFSLASYPATYEDKDGFYALVLLYLLPLGLWLFIMRKDDNLQWLFVVWLLYTIVFVIFIGVIFGGDEPLENKLKKEEFFGPNVLKMTLCLSPVLLLLLLSTGTDSMSYIELTGMLSLRIALDLFDAVEMLEVILEENELSHEILRSFEEGIIVVVCFSFLLSTLQLMEIKLDDGDWKPRKCTSVSRKTLQILFVNGVFLVLRLILFRKYGKDASIFTAKNGIIIFLSLFEICSTYKCCGCEDY